MGEEGLSSSTACRKMAAKTGSCHKRQKPQAPKTTSAKNHKRQKPQSPTPQTPIRNLQTRKVANA